MDPLDIRRRRPAQTNTKQPLRETASQTAGPYVHIGCLPNRIGIHGIYANDLVSNHAGIDGDTIKITGRVFEGDDIVCKDAMLEFWQADKSGDYAYGYWTRAGTDLETGFYEIETVLPGSSFDATGNSLAPFIGVWIVARGINIGLLTRIYFPEFDVQNVADPHLGLVDPFRRNTLLAQSAAASGEYIFDIHLQGKTETVFFET